MVLNKINSFSNLGKGLLEKFQGACRPQAHGGKDVLRTGPVSGDIRSQSAEKAEISAQAHRLIALRNAVDSGLKALEQLPDVRQDRLERARSRLDQGFYNSLEVRTLVAQRLGGVTREMEDL